MNNHSNSKNIKVTYFINEQESSVSFLPTNTLSVLKNIIAMSLNINFDSYDIIYGKKIITKDSDNNTLLSIVGRDKIPVFFIHKKRKREVAERDKMKKIKNTITIENFPYKEDISVYIDRFISQKKTKCNYTTETSIRNPNLVEVNFFNSDVAIDFLKFIGYEKVNNPKFKNTHVNLRLDDLNEKGGEYANSGSNVNVINLQDPVRNSSNLNSSSKRINTLDDYSNSMRRVKTKEDNLDDIGRAKAASNAYKDIAPRKQVFSPDQSLQNKNNLVLPQIKSTKLQLSQSNLNGNQQVNPYSYQANNNYQPFKPSIENLKQKSHIIKNMYASLKTDESKVTIREISPYLTEDDVYHMKIVDNNRKRINAKDFDHYPSQKQIHNKMINDFAVKTPSEHLLNHKFREIHKEKWMDKHDFVKYNRNNPA